MAYLGGWLEDPMNIFGDQRRPLETSASSTALLERRRVRAPGSGDCLGSSPSYYETLQAADIDGDGVDELVARASDGLRVKK